MGNDRSVPTPHTVRAVAARAGPLNGIGSADGALCIAFNESGLPILRALVDWSRTMTETSALFSSSRWMTYGEAAERLGLTPGLVAARARRRRWRTRTCSDTGEAEVEVPAALLENDSVEIELEPDLRLRERVARAVGQVDRAEAARIREKAFAEERAIAKERAAALKRPWWRRA